MITIKAPVTDCLQEIISLFKSPDYNNHSTYQLVSKEIEQAANNLLTTHLTVKNAWEYIKPGIHNLSKSPAFRQESSKIVMELIMEKSPEISAAVNGLIEEYIESQDFITKNVMKGLKSFSGFDEEKVRCKVQEYLKDESNYNNLVTGIEDRLENIEEYLNREEIKSSIHRELISMGKHLISKGEKKGIQLIGDKLNVYLAQESSWKKIDEILLKGLNGLEELIREQLNKPETVEAVKARLPELIKSLHIKKIAVDNLEKQNVDEFERMIMDVADDNLAAIELLGGIVGIAAGILLLV